MKYVNYTTLSGLIMQERKRKKVSQEEAAHKLNITRKTYGGKEQKPERFTVWELSKLAQILDTTPADLLNEAVKEI